MRAGRDVYATCAACHGDSGQGGAGPALAGVLETFPDCETHIRWISLGSEGWEREVGPEYGARGKTIEGAMPGFESLGEPALRQIAMYERMRFGGGEPAEVRSDCGLG